ncbi:jerky protein homolog-like [Erpetoichthys calabaricus]|uniref:jerky protein homolog-like n=1 Tax=Erpetoichthys calabaricus TaxID=27687 RepID=UPI00109F1F1E|nr:jerky protein homolog-like [Erpetoichthys calabaricus]
MSNKRKHASYDVQQKLDVIERIRNGKTRIKVSRELGVPESTLRGWIKDENKLRTFLDEFDEGGLRRKTARTAKDPELDKATFNAFCETRNNGIPISGPVIQAQAEKLYKEIHGPNADPEFTVSSGWLKRWKQRHGISQVKINGEIKSADTVAAEEFIPKFQQFIEEQQLTEEMIYNADETGLYYKILPDRTLAMKKDKTTKEGYKQIKDRVTMLFCCNWTGHHKLTPLCIGKFGSPRCFHNINMSSLPLDYDHSKNAWMTAAIFEKWFHQTFIPDIRRHLRSKGMEPRACLLLDNCPAHPPAETLKSIDGKIFVYYLPKNTTSKIQPLDQGIISVFKANYRREMIKSMVEEDKSVPMFLKTVRIKEALYLSESAWGAIKPETIQNCWTKALGGPITENPTTVEEDEDEDFLGFSPEEVQEAEQKLMSAVHSSVPVQEILAAWSTIDDDVPIALSILAEDNHNEDEEEEEDPVPIPPTRTADDAVKGLEVALEYYERVGDKVKTLQLKSLIRDAKMRASRNKKQADITSYFTKK